MNSTVAVFVCDRNFFDKFIDTCSQLLNNGKFGGDVCLIICDDLVGSDKLKCDFMIQNKIIIKHFPNIDFPDWFLDCLKNVDNPISFNKRVGQFHKFHVFNVFFKKWDYVWYIDSGASIYSGVSPLLDKVEKGVLLAHSDAYPTYEWKLHTQFEKQEPYFTNLNNRYNLNTDYFQTATMLFDTNIIDNNTFDELHRLMLTYPISRTNDQGIMNIYFTKIRNCWKQVPLGEEDGIHYYYDFMPRHPSYKYIMTKYR